LNIIALPQRGFVYSVDYAAIVPIDKAAGNDVIPPRSIGGITVLAA